jgi:hypothetical protein
MNGLPEIKNKEEAAELLDVEVIACLTSYQTRRERWIKH